jgi:pimeloyl-ACP methyl ester carboxylesterase
MQRASRWAVPIAVAAALALPLGLAGCGDDGTAKSADAASTTTRVTEPAPPAVVAGEVEVGEGRHLRARCSGTGSPTVLLETGGSGDLDDWPTAFVDRLARETTTCLYSRAGGRGSSPLAGPSTRAQIVGDASALLDALHRDHGVDGPYVLVGQSFGGSVALAEALEHPETTIGLVVLDTNFPSDFVPACRASGHTAEECQASFDEDAEAKSIEQDIVARLRPLPDIPVAVVSALDQPECHLQPGAANVTAEIAGTDVTAPDCEALGVAIADKNRADWSRLGSPLTDTRIDADHDGLVAAASTQIAEIVLRMVATAR